MEKLINIYNQLLSEEKVTVEMLERNVDLYNIYPQSIHKLNNEYRFKNEIYEVLNTFEDTYSEFLMKHIGRHLDKLKLSKL